MKWLKMFRYQVNLANCYSVLVVPRVTGYRPFAAFAGSFGFPPEKLSVYISNTARGLGFAIEINTAQTEFGEFDTPEPVNDPVTPYGLVKPVASFDSDQWRAGL